MKCSLDSDQEGELQMLYCCGINRKPRAKDVEGKYSKHAAHVKSNRQLQL